MRMKQKTGRWIALLAILAMIAAACGGDSGEGDDGTAATAAEVPAEAETPAEPAALPGEGITVTAARANWSTGYFQAALYSALLQELGYTVTDPAQNEFPPGNAYVAMAEGVIDFWPNSWYPGHLSWHEPELTDGSTVGENLVIIGEELMAAGLEGILITKSVAEEYGITSLAQINDDPELAALFDVDGDGIADLFGCPEDWTCDNIMSETIEKNGWENIRQTKAGYDGMIAESVNRVNAGEPTLQYTWSPSGYLTQLIPGDNVLWLSLGGNEYVIDGTTEGGFDFSDAAPAPLGDQCTDDPCWLGFVSADIQVTANKDFADANPAAVALFEIVRLNVIDVALENVAYSNGENSEDDVKRHAAEWIANNRATVDEWIAFALAAAG